MKLKLSLFIASILIAGVILVVSLASSIRGGSVSPREYLDANLLFSSHVMPGHILYPFLVFRDKYQLFEASSDEQFAARVSLSSIRLEYAKGLLEAGAKDLSISTLKKSQHYAFSSQKFIHNSQEKKFLAEMMKKMQDFIEDHKDEYTDEQKALLDNMFTENHYLLLQLEEN